MEQFVHGHVCANSEIVQRSKGRLFSKPGFSSSATGWLQGWLEVHWRISCELYHLGEEVSPSLLWQLSHTSPKCTTLRDPLSPVSCRAQDRQDQACCRDRRWGMETRVLKHHPNPGRRDNCRYCPLLGSGMEDAALKCWSLFYALLQSHSPAALGETRGCISSDCSWCPTDVPVDMGLGCKGMGAPPAPEPPSPGLGSLLAKVKL